MPKGIPKDGTRRTNGFASMDPEVHRKIASMGGKAAHAKGRAHQFTPQEAREAGRLGGLKRKAAREAAKKQEQ